MSSGRFLYRLLLCLAVSSLLAAAQSNSNNSVASTVSATWVDLLRDLPVVSWFAPAAPDPASVVPKVVTPACGIASLPPISDSTALSFESSESQQGAIDLGGLRPPMMRALERLRQMVASAGGTFELKSAYRPEAYQEHLQEVWFKWMQLRYNRDPGCQTLRASVQDEFARHHLLESQKPVTSSDHTRGLAFDAVIVLPKVARLNRRRVNLNRLTLLAGLRRPDVFHDPVHFKLAVAAPRRVRHV